MAEQDPIIKAALAKVEYTVTVLDGPDALWLVRSFHLREALSEPYELELELVTEDLDVDSEALLGASIEVTLEREVLVRRVAGLIAMVEDRGRAGDRLLVRVEVVPALRLLGQRVDTRLWQHASVPEVVAEVLEAALADYGRSVDLGRLIASYPAREYIVQYHESDLDFVSRLLEEEGISYWFDHEDEAGKELLVLEDCNDNLALVSTIDAAAEIPVIAEHADNAELESVQSFDWIRLLTPTAIHRRVYDWLNPTQPLEVTAAGADERGRVREIYTHGRFVEADPEPRAQRKLEHERQRDRLARGVANVIGISPGRRFALVGHARAELEREYLIRRVEHLGDCPEVVLGQAPSGGPRYQCRFECMEFLPERPFRPPQKTPRPRIQGPQTAIVTGPEGEEIHTDEHGRVKVRFDWDRVHSLHDDSSMWVRVSHPWAGPGFGTLLIPRVGMEVVVEFIEGDPAKPLISGCVCNGANGASVALPDAKTQSGLRSLSSPGGGGYNELRFEDAAGCESISLHAQKDLVEVIENDHTTTVHNNQTLTVDVDQTTTVTGNQTISVTGDRCLSVTGDLSRSITGKSTFSVAQDHDVTIVGKRSATIQGGQDTITVTGDFCLSTSNEISLTAPTKISLACGGASIEMTPGKITLCVNGSSLTLDGAALLNSENGSFVSLDADAAVVASTGGSLGLTAAAILASSEGASSVALDSAGARLSSDAEASVAAPKAMLAGAEVSTVVAEAAGLNAGGPKVDIAASGTATVTGAMVKIN